MSRFAKSLIVDLLEQENEIKAFFGGGFKPPTKGHFLVVKKALETYPEIDTLYVVIGTGLRDNISQDESYSIWEIYKKYLPLGKVEIIKASNSPIKYVKDYIKANTKHKSYIFIGTREDNDDDSDDFIKRKDLFDRYGDHVEVKRIITPDGISGTKAREAAKIDKYQFYQFIPDQLTNEEKETIYNYIQSALQEGTIKTNKLEELSTGKIKSKLKFILGALKQESSETKEAFSKIIKSSKGEITLTDEEKKEIGEQMKDVLKLAGLATVSLIPGGTIAAILIKLFKAEKYITPSSFKKPQIKDNIDEIVSEESNKTFDYDAQINSLTEFMLDLGLNINPLPKVEFIHDDISNAEDFFGKTAYYDPQYNKIVLYTLNRHPKDVMRSFSHEMIHHMQNCEDRLGQITTQNTNEDDHLDGIEREAYEKGNICFRNWTDTLTEAIIKDKIKCDNCGWDWKIKDGGDDLYICHKCNHDNTPQNENSQPQKKSISIDMGKVNKALLDGMDHEKETDENILAIIDSHPSGIIPHQTFLNFYSKFDKYFGEEDDSRTLDEVGLKYILNKILKLPLEDQRIIFNDYQEGNQDLEDVNWFEKYDETHQKDEEWNPVGGEKFDDSKDDIESVNKYLSKNKRLHENIDPKSQSKHKGKSSPYGSAYEPLNEGRYDRITNKISSQVFNKWKSDIDLNIDSDEEQVSEYDFSVDEQDLKFDVLTRLILEPGIDELETIDTTGAGTDKKGDFINIHLRIDPGMLPEFYGGISMLLKDIVRHEIEHLTHNIRAKSNIGIKSMPDDSVRRARIKAGELPQSEYFKLPKEIDANLQGLYLRAKKIRKPFSLVINNFLDSKNYTPKEREEILNLWRPRAKFLNLPKF